MTAKRKNTRKIHVLILRKKTLAAVASAIIAVGLLVCGGFTLSSSAVFRPADKTVVVIDAGHGGRDRGVVGPGKTEEAAFNLLLSKELGELLEDAGFEVVYTRKDEKALCDDGSNFKKRDMAERKRIIEKALPDIVVSIHANKFPLRERRGAQVFFDGFNEDGKFLAEDIQRDLNILNDKYAKRTFRALSGDYFILKCTHAPAVIVECGFLSNPRDEELLNTPEYRGKLAFSIYSGIVSFLSRDKGLTQTP